MFNQVDPCLLYLLKLSQAFEIYIYAPDKVIEYNIPFIQLILFIAIGRFTELFQTNKQTQKTLENGLAFPI